MGFNWDFLILGLVLLAIGAALGGLAWHGFEFRRFRQRLQRIESDLRRLQSDIAALSACQAEALEFDQNQSGVIPGLEKRLEVLDQRLRLISRRQDEQLNTGDPGETSYGAAIRLAHQGANADLLINTFGLARGEAELITALHHSTQKSPEEQTID